MIGFVPAAELTEDPFEELLASFSELPGSIVKAQEFAQSALLPKALGTKDKKWTKTSLRNMVFNGGLDLVAHRQNSKLLLRGQLSQASRGYSLSLT